MALAVSIFGVAFAAFCIWLTVRIVNRREEWAMWTLAGLLACGLLMVAGFVGVIWIFTQQYRMGPAP